VDYVKIPYTNSLYKRLKIVEVEIWEYSCFSLALQSMQHVNRALSHVIVKFSIQYW